MAENERGSGTRDTWPLVGVAGDCGGLRSVFFFFLDNDGLSSSWQAHALLLFAVLWLFWVLVLARMSRPG